MVLISQLFGGIGLFLLGVFLMTDGLKTAGGESLRRILVKFTGRPFTAFVTGTGMTVLAQSSSATTLAVIGFVSAGILTFSQAIGLVIGATLGTTSTGWLVALVGLKFGIGKLAFPLIGLGAMVRLVTHGRNAALALAVAGFGLMFVGIDTLQTGMVTLSNFFSPEQLPRATFGGRVVLVIIGIILTIIMQSSAAAIATTLAAFHSGVIDLEQGASLIIGQSIGTTSTSAVAAINATVAAKRTALAHVLFSAIAGMLAFVLLPFFVIAVKQMAVHLTWKPGAVVLAAFHSGFTLLAALVVLPGVGRFSAVAERLIPERQASLTRRLDASVAELPAVAIEAIRRTLNDILLEMISVSRRVLLHEGARQDHINEIINGLKETRRFLATVPSLSTKGEQLAIRISLIHAWDHLNQLAVVVKSPPKPAFPDAEARLKEPSGNLLQLLDSAERCLRGPDPELSLGVVQSQSHKLAEHRRGERALLLEETAHVKVEPGAALRILKGLRWFDAIGYHTWRASHHLINQGSTDSVADEATIPAREEFASS